MYVTSNQAQNRMLVIYNWLSFVMLFCQNILADLHCLISHREQTLNMGNLDLVIAGVATTRPTSDTQGRVGWWGTEQAGVCCVVLNAR